MLVHFGLSADYDPNLAERLVYYASASYCCGTEQVTNWDCPGCKKVPGFSRISQVFGPRLHGRALIGFDSVLNARIVAFEGTHADVHTILDDVNVLPAPCYTDGCPGCTCHPGFLSTYSEIAGEVYSAVSQLPPGKLMVTGHSLGAAQATHCAHDLHTKGLRPDHIYTFGQPRVGNSAFAYYYMGFQFDHWRVTHHRDPVPHLPWRGIGSYFHISREAYYESDAPPRVCSAVNPEDPLCADQFNDELSFLHWMDHEHYVGLNMVTDLVACAWGTSNSSVMI